MVYEELELRRKANIEKYIYNNTEEWADSVMALYESIPDVGGGLNLFIDIDP